MTIWRKLNSFMDADDGAGGGGTPPSTPPTTDPNAGGTTPAVDPNGAGNPDTGGNLPKTQADLDRIIQREKAKAQKQAKDEFEAAQKTAQMTETERLKAEKEASEKALADERASTKDLLVKTEAIVQATAQGAKPEKLDYIVKLLDLKDVDVDANRQVDKEAVTAAITKLKADIPELFGAGVAPKGGTDFTGGGGELSIDSEIVEAQKKGDWLKVTELQMKKYERDKLKT